MIVITTTFKAVSSVEQKNVMCEIHLLPELLLGFIGLRRIFSAPPGNVKLWARKKLCPTQKRIGVLELSPGVQQGIPRCQNLRSSLSGRDTTKKPQRSVFHVFITHVRHEKLPHTTESFVDTYEGPNQ